MLHNEQDA